MGLFSKLRYKTEPFLETRETEGGVSGFVFDFLFLVRDDHHLKRDLSNKNKYEPLFMYKRVRQISHAGRLIKELIKKGPFLNHIVVVLIKMVYSYKNETSLKRVLF